MINWFSEHWISIVVPVAVFLAALIATFWLRRLAYQAINKRISNAAWPADKVLVQSTRVPSALWCLFVSGGLAIAVSMVPAGWKTPINNGLWTILLVSITLTLLNITGSLIAYFAPRFKIPHHVVTIMRNASRIAISVVAVLIVLAIWGVPTSAILLLLAVIALVGILALRDVFPNFVASFQINAAGQVKKGDYIKLGTGEEGYITEIDWRTTRLQTVDGTTIILPNSKLLQSSLVNYGHPLKQAKEPFRFHTRVDLTELTGLRARNLQEFVTVLRTSPDAVVYYHTHHFLEQHHYLTPEPANDFALWVSEAIGDEALGERLASVDTFEFSNLSSLRDRFVGIIDECLALSPNNREVMSGREFHFMKSVVMILPTPYLAHDLRELAEALRKISLGSIYFHIFESRLRLGKGLNDFTVWLKNDLAESELAEEIARLDPYTYTLEGLRSLLIQMIEKRIK